MQTSAKGIVALELEEGVVLKAYRCPAGVWTIGAGLTAASGVMKPRAGMVISKEQATNFLQEALRTRYEPAVAIAMSSVDGSKVTRAAQNEFDAGVSFHWNTGAIGRASWVKIWVNLGKPRASGPDEVRNALLAWTRGGGKVLPGLTARRKREAAMLLDGVYRGVPPQTEQPSSVNARISLPLSGTETKALREGLRALGYDPGSAVNAVAILAAQAFQRDHNLTVDGIIGRATLSTLQRALDARTKAKTSMAATVVAAPAASTGLIDHLAGLPWAEPLVYAALALWAGALAYRYRDIIAAKIARPLPRIATFLWSF